MSYIPQPTVFFRKSVVNAIGYFDDTLHLAMDYDYWLRLILKFKYTYIPEPLAMARIYKEAKSSQFDYKYLNERLYVISKLFRYNPNLDYKKESIIAYTYFIRGFNIFKKIQNNIFHKEYSESCKYDISYILNPHLYWTFFEILFGKEITSKLHSFFKKIYAKNIDEII